jgi:hypothetical protein
MVTRTHLIITFNTYCSPTVTMVTRTHLIITLYYAHCLSSLSIENGRQYVKWNGHSVFRVLG